MADRGRGGRGGGRGGRGGGGGGGGGGGQGRGRGAPQGPPQGQGGAFRGGAFRGGGFGGAGGGAGFRGGGPPGRGGREPPRVYAPSPDGSPPLPDAKVTQVEDARQKARKTSDLSAAMGKLQLASPGGFMPPRPGYGTGGKNITVYANYTQLTPSSDLTLYAYDISEVKDDVAGRKRTQLMRLLVNESPELEGYRSHIVTDFKSTLISRKKLDLPTGAVDIVYKAEGEDEPLDRAKKYTIKIKYTKTLRVSDLMTYLTSTNPAAGQQYDNKLEMIQALNILFNHYVKSSPDKLATIGASKTFSLDTTDLENRCNLGQGLHAIRGFFTSVRAATNRILVNVNVSHGAFYQEGELQSLMEAYRGANAHHDRNTQGAGQYNDYILRRLNMFLKKVRVRTIHLPVKTNKKGEIVARMKSIFALASPKDGFEMKRRPRVQKLGAGPTAVEFWVEDTPFQGAPGPGAAASAQAPASAKKGKGKGKPPASNPQHAGAEAGRYVTVFDYFRSKYPHIRLNPNLPVVNVGTNGRPSYLPAEACIVLPGQNAMTKLDGRQTQQMIHFAVRGPWKNAESIVKPGFETAGLSANKNHLLAQFGIQVGNSLITVPARLLPEPTVLYRKFEPNSQPNSKAIQVMNGSWNMDKIKFNQPGRLQTWSWMAISISASARQEVTDTIVKFRAALVKNGVNAAVEIPGKHIEVPQVKDQIEQFDKLVAGNQKLLLIILPGRDKSDNTLLYSQIKKWGDTRFGVHTVCVIGHKFMGTKGQDQYFANVALKFNLKLGGNNQGIDPARLSFINQDKTMLVGIDVTHPSPGSHKDAPSVAGMVASTDRHLGQWPGTLRQQKGKQEKVDDLKDMLKHHLDNWKTIGKHQAYPENILVYRDGVSEGQYQIVVDQEIPLLREACREKYPPNGPPPRLTVVIVGKRHHTRFYPTKQQDMDRSGNCKAGTVVDRGVTEEGIWDFFLQSHAVIQGTGRPAHYVVVLDEIFRYQAQLKGKANISEAANELERVTQALCYSYSRATKAVSICTPAYHADILCERARRYMAGLFEESNSEDGSSVTKEKEWTIHPRLQNSMFYI